MRKKTMQLREKPLVYPRYPERQTLHHHSSDAKSETARPRSSLAGSNAGTVNEISSVEPCANNTLMTQ